MKKARKSPAPVVVVRPTECPHCGAPGTAKKLRGAHSIIRVGDEELRYFRAQCSDCEGFLIIREAWPIKEKRQIMHKSP